MDYQEEAASHAQSTTIALIGKYTSFADSYVPVIKALKRSAMACQRKLRLIMVDASHLEENSPLEKYEVAWEVVKTADGILIPGGFGSRGTEGVPLSVGLQRPHFRQKGRLRGAHGDI